MDWFAYDRDLRHDTFNLLSALEQVTGVIRADQTSMMVLLTKIFSNINLKT